MNQTLTIALATLALAAPDLSGQTSADSAAIRAAVSDYVEGFYQGDTIRFNRSIRRDVHKFSFMKNDATKKYDKGTLMAWKYFLDSADEVRRGVDKAPAGALRRIELVDVLDQIAIAKLTAMWGVDYLTLGKYDGRWMIQQVIAQGAPVAATKR